MFHLTIVTPEEIVYEGEIHSAIIPGSEGYLGVMTDHAPLITAVIPGKLTLREKSRSEVVLAVSYGFFEVSGNRATLLVDAVEVINKIDLDRARQALERARRRLASPIPEGTDVARARRALERARNRIRISQAAKE